nr:GNAT family N-acetyltransferase [uncultured Cellulosilyticum sp.]
MTKEISQEMLKDLSELFIEAFNAPPWKDKWRMETASKRLLDFINTPGFYGLAKYEDEKVVGMILGRKEQYYDGIYFQILEFCVDSTRQGQGLGKELLSRMLAKLKEQHVKKVFLLTLHDESTKGFYEKCGFKLDEMTIMMNKSLESI